MLTFFGQLEVNFHDLCRRPLWTAPEQKTAKLSIGYPAYRLTNSYTIDSLYRVCIKSLWLYHDHL